MPSSCYTYDSSTKSRVHVSLLIIDGVSEPRDGSASTNAGVKAVRMATTKARSAVFKT